MILLGFGVYTGHDKDIMDLDQIVVFDRTTTTINIWNVQQSSNQAARLIACQSEIITTKMARAKILQKGDQVWEHSRSIFLSKPLCLSQGEKIDVEHNLVPTDVTNHFSGQPFTLMGADLWTMPNPTSFRSHLSEVGGEDVVAFMKDNYHISYFGLV